jgi:hypothetical protein
MHVITTDTVDNALALGLEYLVATGIEEPSRNGPVLVSNVPVTTVYTKPQQRVLFGSLRNANPFFHLFEALWMLGGRNDIEFVKQFNSRMGQYSDDQVTQRGAYGYRWRKWFGYDQLEVIAKELKANPTSRRCVLAMWDGGEHSYTSIDNLEPGDLLATTVDKPCNTHIYFRVNNGRLDMTVCCRSNDVLWGAYGANVVHMSILLEFMATWVGIPMGRYYQISNNYHLYTDVLSAYQAMEMAQNCRLSGQYGSPTSKHTLPIINIPIKSWHVDLNSFLDNPLDSCFSVDTFFRETCYPMFKAWQFRRDPISLSWAGRIAAPDWRLASTGWITRFQTKKGI